MDPWQNHAVRPDPGVVLDRHGFPHHRVIHDVLSVIVRPRCNRRVSTDHDAIADVDTAPTPHVHECRERDLLAEVDRLRFRHHHGPLDTHILTAGSETALEVENIRVRFDLLHQAE